MKLFSVLDVKSKSYLKLWAEKSTVEAVRGFNVTVNETDTMFKRFPDDFCLMEIGSWDQATGILTPLDSPLNLGSARTFLRESIDSPSLPFSPKSRSAQ